jgi:hypothetical protein
MISKAIFILILAMAVLNVRADNANEHSYIPDAGFVPDEITAIRIAEAVLIPIYGEASISAEKPFKATLNDGVWTVTGSLPRNKLGGVAIAQISKKDGRIERVSHGK